MERLSSDQSLVHDYSVEKRIQLVISSTIIDILLMSMNPAARLKRIKAYGRAFEVKEDGCVSALSYAVQSLP